MTAYRQSGLTQSDFAARNGLSLSCLGIWLRKSRGSGGDLVPHKWVQLPVNLTMGSKYRPIYKIGFPSGQSLEVSAGFDIKEATASLREAIRLIFEDRLEDGRRGLPEGAIQTVVALG